MENGLNEFFTNREVSDGLFLIHRYQMPNEVDFNSVFARRMDNGKWEWIMDDSTSFSTAGEVYDTLQECIDSYKEVLAAY